MIALATVKIRLSHELEGMPFELEATADTGISPPEWAAMTEAQREAVCGPILDAWVKSITEVNWEVLDA